MRRLVILIALAVPLGARPLVTTAGDDEPCLPLAVTKPDGNYIVPGARGGIVYRRVDGRELMLDAWTPPRTDTPADVVRGGPRPVVLAIHGGGFIAGSRVAFVGQFLELLTVAGYPWVSVDYRLNGPERLADAADDVRAAVAFVRCHAGDLGIDPGQILLLGEDAGAALAMTVAGSVSPGVIGAVLLGGLFADAPDAASRVPSTDVAPGRQSRRPARSPRFLVVHGTSDTEVALARAEAWCRGQRTGACELVAVEGASHRPENWWPVQWGYKSRLIEWLNRVAPVTATQAAAAAPYDLTRPLAHGLHKRISYRQQADANGGGSTTGSHPKVDTTRETELKPGATPSTVDGERSTIGGQRLTVDGQQTMDAWLPLDRSRPVPAVVLLHGGGWEAGDRVTYITPLFEPLARAGFAWFSVDYRLTPAVRHPEQLDDVRTALAFVRTHAQAFGIDATRLVIVGESASAQMATLLAAEDRGLAGVVSFYGVYDFLPMVTDAGPRSLAVRLFGRAALDDDTRTLLRQYSPLHQARRDMAPVLLIHGTSERLWDQGVRMAARLAELGVEHELLRLDGAPHGMENWEGHPEWQFYKPHLVSWIRRQLSRQRRVSTGRR
jgi:acetyl esterase